MVHCAKNKFPEIIYNTELWYFLVTDSRIVRNVHNSNLTKCIWNYVRNCPHSLGFQWLKYTNVPIYSKEINMTWIVMFWWQFYAFLRIFLDISLLKLHRNIIFCTVVMILHMVVIGVVDGLNKGVKKWNTKTIESQRSSLGPYWTFLVLTALKIEDNRHWPALHVSTNTRELWPCNGAKVPLESYTGSKKIKFITETRLVTLEQGTQWNIIVFWASNPFMVNRKFDIVCVEAGFFQIRSHMYTYIWLDFGKSTTLSHVK